MMPAIRWMAKNHVAANLLMLVFIVGGLVIGPKVKQEVFPEISLDTVQISVAYPGAGPEEVEEGILIKIEEAITGVDGIKEITSTAVEGRGTVMAEVRTGEDTDEVLQDIKSEVDRITTFPEDSEEPVVAKLVNRREVITVVVAGDMSEWALRERAEDIRDDLLAMDNITQVDLGGVRPYEISIEIPEENLRRYNLTLEEVARRVKRASQDLPGGTIKTEGGDILLRTKERRYIGEEYGEITVLTRPDGTRVKLADIAAIKDAFQQTDQFARFDGKPAAMVEVYRVGDQKPTDIADQVKEYIKKQQESLPETVTMSVLNDRSDIFQSRMNLLLKNAALGLGLVIIILGVFLEIRLALWVMLGIPISFLGALFLMPVMDVSINMISLFAFILALGIVVDDAIVVGENIYSHRQMDKPFPKAAVDGAIEVAVPVVFAILTTVAAFLPLVFVTGIMGKFIRVIPLVVIALFLVSLVESLFVLPSHLSRGKKRVQAKGILGAIDRVRRRFGDMLKTFINGPYERFLRVSLNNRYVTVATGILLLFLALGLVRGGIIKVTFMPEVEGDRIRVNIRMPEGTPVARTAEVEKYVAAKGLEAVEEIDSNLEEGVSVMRNLYAVVGGTMGGGGPGGGRGTQAANRASLAMYLTKSEKRDVSSTEISRLWREKVGEVPGVEAITFRSSLIHVGDDINIQLAHEDFGVLEQVSQQLQTDLSKYSGVSEIEDTFDRGKQELKITLNPEARTLGITEEDLGRQIRSSFYGAEALRIQRGRNEVKVMVRYPEDQRKSMADLESMRIRTPEGGEIPLLTAATIEQGYGYSSINRADRKRVINVTAAVDENRANPKEILEELEKGFLSSARNDYPGLEYDLEGAEGERAESMASMRQGFLLVLFFIFALLAIPFASYSQPLLIMSAIPFGIVGAVLGHLIMGYDLSFLSMVGIVALTGVVVNDSLLLIDKVNTDRKEGMDTFQALVDGGKRRFRPVLLTSLTTFFGLAPMILEGSVQAKFLIPMAISLGFGILFATSITLLLIPCFYAVLEDIRGLILPASKL